MEYMDYIRELFIGIPRQGPGSDEATKKALSHIVLPYSARILDIGCGTGAQTMVLLNNTSAHVTALDFFAEFLEVLKKKASEKGFSGRLETVKGDMFTMDFPQEYFDMIWSEGAAYIMGFENAITDWSRHLKKGGFAVISEATYINEEIPDEALKYWVKNYPGMGSEQGNMACAKSHGYDVVSTFRLGRQAWEDYYAALEASLEKFSKRFNDTSAAQIVLEIRQEINIFERYFGVYDYVFYILRKN